MPCKKGGSPWSPSQNCYFTPVTDQRAAFQHTTSGTTPADGTYYACQSGRLFFSATPPAKPDPADLAWRVMDRMTFSPISIGMVPRQRNAGLVGLPVWMWVSNPGPTTWGPLNDGLSERGVSVRVTGKVTEVAWDMGDGTTVTCQQGTPYRRTSDPQAQSPDCGHRYDRKGTYQITATSTWQFNWTSNTGQSGSESVPVSSSRTIAVGELQVLN